MQWRNAVVLRLGIFECFIVISDDSKSEVPSSFTSNVSRISLFTRTARTISVEFTFASLRLAGKASSFNSEIAWSVAAWIFGWSFLPAFLNRFNLSNLLMPNTAFYGLRKSAIRSSMFSYFSISGSSRSASCSIIAQRRSISASWSLWRAYMKLSMLTISDCPWAAYFGAEDSANFESIFWNSSTVFLTVSSVIFARRHSSSSGSSGFSNPPDSSSKLGKRLIACSADRTS